MPRPMHTLGDARIAGLELTAVCHNVACRHRLKVDLVHVIRHVGELHPLLPVRGHPHYSERLRCPVCGHRGFFVWAAPGQEPTPAFGELRRGYTINDWSDGGALINRLAIVSHLRVAHAAYRSALHEYPGRRITLEQGALLMEDSRFRVIEGGKTQFQK